MFKKDGEFIMGNLEKGLTIYQAVKEVAIAINGIIGINQRKTNTVIAGDIAQLRIQINEAIKTAHGEASARILRDNLRHIKNTVDQLEGYNLPEAAAKMAWQQLYTLHNGLNKNLEEFLNGIHLV
jgi:hypothetical protein